MLKTVFAKAGNGSIPSGATAIVGDNSNALPGADNADAVGVPVYQGLQPHNPWDITFARNAQDLTFYFEASMDGSLWRPVSMVRLDTGAVVPNVTLGASGGMMVVPGNAAGFMFGVHAVRMRCFLAAADNSANAYVIIKTRAGRSSGAI